MRIGEVNQHNYTEYMKLFAGKTSKNKNQNQIFAQSSSMSKNNSVKQASSQLSDVSYPKWGQTIIRETPTEPPMEGMDATGRNPNSYKIVPVSDDIKQKLTSIAKDEFINNNGIGRGDEVPNVIKQYLSTVPAAQRLDVAYTLDKIHHDAAVTCRDAIRAKNPNWQFGQSVAPHVLDNVDLNNGIDKKV